MATQKDRKNIYLQHDLAVRVQADADRLGISFGSYVAVALEHYLAHKGRSLYELIENHKEGET